MRLRVFLSISKPLLFSNSFLTSFLSSTKEILPCLMT
jgi:hypothetical protein